MEKRVVKLAVVLLLTLILSFILVACNNGTPGGDDIHQEPFFVSFYDGETLLNSQTIENIDKLKLPTPPVKEGYTFNGWVDKNGCKIDPLKIELTGDIVLYTKYDKQSLQVSFNTLTEEAIQVVDVIYGEKVLKPEDPIREGYDFIGWYTDEALTKTYDFNNAVLENLVLYAAWGIKSYLVTFDTNCEINLADINLDYNEELIVPNLTREGYTFIGWYLDKTFSEKVEKLTVRENTTLYAKWNINSYEITFDNKTCGEVKSLIIDYNEQISLEPLEKEGNQFVGFYEDKDYKKKFTITKMPSRDIKLYAKWNLLSYKVTVNTGYDVKENDFELKFGETIVAPTLMREGYTLVGWYIDKDYIEILTNETMPSHDVTIYAKWDRNIYEVTLHNLDKVTEITYTYGIEKTLPIPINKDKIFEGWYETRDYLGSPVSVIPIDEIGNKEYFSKWKDGAKSITILSENMPDTVITALPGDAVIEPEITREGYSYKGLYLDKEFTKPYTFTVMPNEHLTVYCKWEINSYNIIFKPNSYLDDISKVFQYGSAIEFPILNRLGYNLLGWYLDENLQIPNDIETMPSHDIILFAKWDHVIYHVKFDTMGGSPISSIHGHYNDIIEVPKEPKKQGFAFKGWYKDKNLIFPFDFAINNRFSNSNMVLYAKWAEICEVQIMNGLYQYGNSYYVPRGDTFKLSSPITGSQLYNPDCYFKGWYYDATFTNPCDIELVISDPVTRIYGKWINYSFVPLLDKFDGGNTENTPIMLKARNEFVSLLEYLSIKKITYLRMKYIVLDYSVSSFANEFQSCILKTTTSVYDYFSVKKPYDVYGIYVDIVRNDLVKTANPIKKEKIANAFTSSVTEPRTKDFDTFKYKEYKEEQEVNTSDQLFYALQYGYMPIPQKNSSAERMLNAAKTVLREICDDKMTDREKMFAIYNWISGNIYYDYCALNISLGKLALLNVSEAESRKYSQYSEAWYLEGVFDSHLAVCDGISKAVVVLARIEGIPCVRVRSYDHAWNKVYLDINDEGNKAWYGFDATWAYSNLQDIGQSILYDHFLFTDIDKEVNRGQKATNFLYIEAKTDVNPYEYANGNKYDDLLIDSDIELTNIIKQGYETLSKNRELDKVALNINIQYLEQDLINQKILNIVEVQNIGLFKPNVNCQVFIEENKYNLKGEIVIIILERKTLKL